MEAGSAFGRAVEAAIATSGTTKKALADHLDMDPSNVNNWITRTNVDPERWRVFKAETVLGCSPGSLSRHLGYLPAEGYEPCSVDDALLAEVGAGELDGQAYQAMMTVYWAFKPRQAQADRQSA